MRMVFPSAEIRERVARLFGVEEGGIQTLDKLATHLTPQNLWQGEFP